MGHGGVAGGWWDRGAPGARGCRHPPPVSSRMEGFGYYTLPTGTEYRGSLWDGMFHGQGELLLPSGGGYRALWVRGVPTQVRPGGFSPRGLRW